MTVIVWDGTSLAADKQGCVGDMRINRTKIQRRADGTLVATAGCYALASLCIAAIFDGGAWPKADDGDCCDVIVVRPDGVLQWWTHGYNAPLELHQRWMVWGIGREFAAGAMAMGADAERAVEVAIALCPGCGPGIQVEQPGMKNPG